MPQFRVSKNNRSSTTRRHALIARIESFGFQKFAMGRCTPCQNANSLCFMLDGYSKCSSCLKKGVPYCDGVFSEEDFDALTAQRNRLTEAARRKGEEIKEMLAEAARVHAQMMADVSRVHAERERLQQDADNLLEKQRKMLVQEANALEDLDHIDPPPIASSTVFVGLGDTQLEQMFELVPGSMAGFEGPIPIDRPPA
jgi:hypothetical protein